MSWKESRGFGETAAAMVVAGLAAALILNCDFPSQQRTHVRARAGEIAAAQKRLTGLIPVQYGVKIPPAPIAGRETPIGQDNLRRLLEGAVYRDDLMFEEVLNGWWSNGGRGRSIQESFAVDFKTRRLLELAQQDRPLIAGTMERLLSEALADWPEAYKDEYVHLRERIKNPSFNSRYHGCCRETALATYVLGEIRQHSSLKLLHESFRSQIEWVDAVPEKESIIFISQCPAPLSMTLYAMHRLISSYPERTLSGASLAAQRRYMSWAGAHVPPPRIFAESRRIQLDDLEEAMEPAKTGEPVMVVVYPDRFINGPMQKYPAVPYITDQSREWFRQMEPFLDSLP